jgi:hypothetical protein
MYKHLFDMACTEAELASYYTCSGFHFCFRRLFLQQESRNIKSYCLDV